ncbi:MAG: gamma-glutamylcyclotransferase [Rhodospirillaceae bacterium]|nr:gamma-glutamylcyclotransferase [Rhodospirillaceae bacterium]
MYYFAYGANLNKRGMKMRCPQATAVGVAVLHGYKLCFKRWADIIPAKDACVHGVLWAVTPACLRALDAYEGDDYGQVKVTVEHNGETVEAIAYAIKTHLPFAPPDMDYHREIAIGYREWGLDEALLRRARYDTLNVGPGNVGPGAAPAPPPAPHQPEATVLPPRRRALWDPATQGKGSMDDVLRVKPKPRS